MAGEARKPKAAAQAQAREAGRAPPEPPHKEEWATAALPAARELPAEQAAKAA
jgi:hypothetical protein